MPNSKQEVCQVFLKNKRFLAQQIMKKVNML